MIASIAYWVYEVPNWKFCTFLGNLGPILWHTLPSNRARSIKKWFCSGKLGTEEPMITFNAKQTSYLLGKSAS